MKLTEDFRFRLRQLANIANGDQDLSLVALDAMAAELRALADAVPVCDHNTGTVAVTLKGGPCSLEKVEVALDAQGHVRTVNGERYFYAAPGGSVTFETRELVFCEVTTRILGGKP